MARSVRLIRMEERISVAFPSGREAEIVIQADFDADMVTIHYPLSGSASVSLEMAYKVADQFTIDEAAEATRKVADAVAEQQCSDE